MDAPLKDEATPRGRLPAGQDPAKRDQILDGAKRCFMNVGFEAASMNDITAEAGVSKGTLYVYFQDKEDLFKEIIDREREALISNVETGLYDSASITEGLTRFGMTVTKKLTSDHVIRAQRMVLGVTERMPDIARRFFGPDPFSALSALQRYLDGCVERGELKIDDTELAGRQFIDLAMASSFKPRLFGNMTGQLSDAEIRRGVESAVAMFLRFYGAN